MKALLKKTVITADDYVELKVTTVTIPSVIDIKDLSLEVRATGFWWWLSTSAAVHSQVREVNPYGVISSGDYTNIPGGIRPLIRFEKNEKIESGDTFILAKQEWLALSQEKALCLKSIGESPFRRDVNASDANIYSASDIKKCVDEWWERNSNEHG